MISEEGSKIGN